MELENQFKDFFLESQGKCGRNEMQSENQTRMSVFYEKEFLKEQYSQVIPWFGCLNYAMQTFAKIKISKIKTIAKKKHFCLENIYNSTP